MDNQNLSGAGNTPSSIPMKTGSTNKTLLFSIIFLVVGIIIGYFGAVLFNKMGGSSADDLETIKMEAEQKVKKEVEQERLSQETFRAGVVKESNPSGLVVEFDQGQLVNVQVDDSTRFTEEIDANPTPDGFATETYSSDSRDISVGDRITVTFSEPINLETKELYAISITKL